MRFASLLVVAFSVVLSACGAQPTVPEVVEISLTEFGIQSTLTEFKIGQPYRFVITNEGALNHEFTIMPPGTLGDMGMDMEGHDMGDMDHNMAGAILHVGQDQLTPGAFVTVEFTFTQTSEFGEVEFACHLPGHYEAGMFAPITIQS